MRVNGTLCSKVRLAPQLGNELEDRFETGVSPGDSDQPCEGRPGRRADGVD